MPTPGVYVVVEDVDAHHDKVAAAGVVATCDLTGIHTLCDVGGGNGTLLAAFLTGHPALRGVLLDTADGLGDAADVLADVADRCEIVAAGWRLRGVEAVPATGMSVLRAEPA